MIIKFNPSGTHIHKGFLKVRLDLYPALTDKTYQMQYVDKPDTPYEPSQQELDSREIDQIKYDAWWATVPKHKELNPCLCHFITIDPETSVLDIVKYIKSILDKTTLTQLDDQLSRGNIKMVSQIMSTKLGIGHKLAESPNIEQLNLLLSSISEVKV